LYSLACRLAIPEYLQETAYLLDKLFKWPE
jgi:hypothetical protein